MQKLEMKNQEKLQQLIQDQKKRQVKNQYPKLHWKTGQNAAPIRELEEEHEIDTPIQNLDSVSNSDNMGLIPSVNKKSDMAVGCDEQEIDYEFR